jgi:protein TonB
METRLLIPVGVAAILHAVVLFSGKSVRMPAVPLTPTRTVEIDHTDPVVDDPEPSEPVVAESRGSWEARPESEEPPVMDRTGIAFTVRPSPAAPLTPTTVIPVEPFGKIGGDESGIGRRPTEFRVGDLDSPPRARSQVAPVYPDGPKNSGTTGDVTVEFIVDENGRVLNPRVVRSTDFRFEVATLQAVSKWRFEPGKVNGRAVKFRMVAPVCFSLNP